MSENAKNVMDEEYSITAIGVSLIKMDGPAQADITRFLSSFDFGTPSTYANLRANWDLVVRVSRDAQSKRIRSKLSELLQFCRESHLIE